MPLNASIVGTPIGSVVGTVTCLVNGTITSNVAVPGPQGPQGPQGPAGPAGADEWGQITGTLSAQTDLQAALDAKYPSSNPAGYQTAAQVTTALLAYAPLASPALTGNPTAPTPALGDNDTSISTTAFVQSALASGTAIARNLEVQVRNQSGSTITAGSIVYISGATGNLPLITKAQANGDSTSAQTIGFVKTDITNNGTGYVIVRGVLDAIDTSSLTEGVQLYLSPTTAGTWTTTKPYAPEHLVYVGIVIRSHPNQGTILVAVQNGYELDEIHNVAALTPSNLDLLSYESSTSLWKNKSFSTLGLLTSATAASTYYLQSNPAGYQTAAQVSTALSPYLLSATAATTYYPLSSNPAGYLVSSALTPYLTISSAASTYQTQAGMTDYLSKAGNLSGLASASTARTNLGLGSASTAAFATNAEAQTGVSTTTVMNPASGQYALASPSFFRISAMTTLSGATSGTGASAQALNGGYRTVAPTSAIGYGIASWGNTFHSRGSGASALTPLPWNKRFFAQFRYNPRQLGTDSNTVNRVCFGKTSGTTTGDLANRGIAIKQVANGALILQVHNGTTLTSVTSSLTPVTTSSYDILITSDGAGNVTMYSNDSQIATTSAGPSTQGANNQTLFTIESENLAAVTGNSNQQYLAEICYAFSIA